MDAVVADRRGRMLAAAGRPLPTIDSLLAATALTRSGAGNPQHKDFTGLPVRVFNPWADSLAA